MSESVKINKRLTRDELAIIRLKIRKALIDLEIAECEANKSAVNVPEHALLTLENLVRDLRLRRQ